LIKYFESATLLETGVSLLVFHFRSCIPLVISVLTKSFVKKHRKHCASRYNFTDSHLFCVPQFFIVGTLCAGANSRRQLTRVISVWVFWLMSKPLVFSSRHLANASCWFCRSQTKKLRRILCGRYLRYRTYHIGALGYRYLSTCIMPISFCMRMPLLI